MKEVKRPFIGSPIFANVVEDEDLIGFIHKVSRVYATGGSREFSTCSWHRVGYMVATTGEDGQIYVDGSWCIAKDSYDQDRGIGLALKYINMQKNGHTPMIKQLVEGRVWSSKKYTFSHGYMLNGKPIIRAYVFPFRSPAEQVRRFVDRACRYFKDHDVSFGVELLQEMQDYGSYVDNHISAEAIRY